MTPTLLRLNGVCDIMNNNVIRRSASPPTGTARPDKSKPKIMRLTDEIVKKDLHAIGTLALEIFTAHIKAKRSATPSVKSVKYCDDELENDFVSSCFMVDSANIDAIWYHPFINNIYSLKVLSVYSILAYFQEKNNASKAKPIERNISSSSFARIQSAESLNISKNLIENNLSIQINQLNNNYIDTQIRLANKFNKVKSYDNFCDIQTANQLLKNNSLGKVYL